MVNKKLLKNYFFVSAIIIAQVFAYQNAFATPKQYENVGVEYSEPQTQNINIVKFNNVVPIVYEKATWKIDPLSGKNMMTYVENGQIKDAKDGFYEVTKTEKTVNSLGIPVEKTKKALYYFNNQGHMQTGWITTADNKKFFFDNEKTANEGCMSTGWKYVQGQWYYFNPDGSMLISSYTPDGYLVNDQGQMLEKNAQTQFEAQQKYREAQLLQGTSYEDLLAQAKVELEMAQAELIQAEQAVNIENMQQQAALQAQQQAALKAEQEAAIKAQQEAQLLAQAKAELDAAALQMQAEEAKAKADYEAAIKAQQEAQLLAQAKAELDAAALQMQAQQQAALQAQQQAALQAQQQAALQAQQQAALQAEQEAAIKAQQEAQLLAQAKAELDAAALQMQAQQQAALQAQQNESLQAYAEAVAKEQQEAAQKNAAQLYANQIAEAQANAQKQAALQAQKQQQAAQLVQQQLALLEQQQAIANAQANVQTNLNAGFSAPTP